MSTLKLGSVLVVDDEPDLLSFVYDALTQLGYEVKVSPSPVQALLALQQQTFDVLLTDLKMPEMDGIELLRAAHQSDSDLVGILMTGYATVETAVQAMKLGAYDYVQKPLKLDDLSLALSRALILRQLRLNNLELREMTAIYELCQSFAHQRLDVDGIVNEVADGALKQSEADEVSIFLTTIPDTELYVAAVRGERTKLQRGQRVSITQGLAGMAARSRKPFLLSAPVDDAEMASAQLPSHVCSALVLPMVTGDKLIGVLSIYASRQRRPIPQRKVKSLSILAATAAAAIENALLREKTHQDEERYRSLFAGTADALMKTWPDGHVPVANLSAARLLGYESPEELFDTISEVGRQLFVVPDRFAELVRMLQEREVIRGFEAQMHRKDGSMMWVAISARLTRHPATGTVIGTEYLLEGITSRTSSR